MWATIEKSGFPDPHMVDFVLKELSWDCSDGCLDIRQRSPLHYACQVRNVGFCSEQEYCCFVL